MTGFLLTTLAGGIANAQEAQFILANNTGFTVHSVYIWPVETEDQGLDWLGSDTIESGGVRVFAPDDGNCRYNIRVTLENREGEKQWDNVNLCRLSTLTLNYNYLRQDLWARRD